MALMTLLNKLRAALERSLRPHQRDARNHWRHSCSASLLGLRQIGIKRRRIIAVSVADADPLGTATLASPRPQCVGVEA